MLKSLCTPVFFKLQDNFRTGNQLQLVSRSSGRTLQIVTAHNGQIVPDGNGMEGPQAVNGKYEDYRIYFTVYRRQFSVFHCCQGRTVKEMVKANSIH